MDEKFVWAKSQADSLSGIRRIRFHNLDRYTDKIGQHVSLYHDTETNETFMCVFLDEDMPKLYWRQIFNFEEMLADNAAIVNLWLRNGEYLHTYVTKGKGLKVVNFSYLQK